MWSRKVVAIPTTSVYETATYRHVQVLGFAIQKGAWKGLKHAQRDMPNDSMGIHNHTLPLGCARRPGGGCKRKLLPYPKSRVAFRAEPLPHIPRRMSTASPAQRRAGGRVRVCALHTARS